MAFEDPKYPVTDPAPSVGACISNFNVKDVATVVVATAGSAAWCYKGGETRWNVTCSCSLSCLAFSVFLGQSVGPSLDWAHVGTSRQVRSCLAVLRGFSSLVTASARCSADHHCRRCVATEARTRERLEPRACPRWCSSPSFFAVARTPDSVRGRGTRLALRPPSCARKSFLFCLPRVLTFPSGHPHTAPSPLCC